MVQQESVSIVQLSILKTKPNKANGYASTVHMQNVYIVWTRSLSQMSLTFRSIISLRRRNWSVKEYIQVM